MHDDLEQAFRATRYEVRLDDTTHVLTVDAPCPAPIAAWLTDTVGASTAWLITADNPGAQRLGDAENTARRAVLAHWAGQHARARLGAVNRDPKRQWPDEHGLLIAGIDEAEARAAALRFGQLALVCVRAHASCTLVWR